MVRFFTLYDGIFGNNEEYRIDSSNLRNEYMKIQSAIIRNFRRFTDLTIDNIPDDARLIMLAGPNGCGKSSLFDAFNIWHRRIKRPGYDPGWDKDYHGKITYYHGKITLPTDRFSGQVDVKFHQEIPRDDNEKKKLFYIRSAYRNDPEFRIQQLDRLGSSLDEATVARMIDNDAAVSRNYQRMVAQSLDGLYDRRHDQMMVPELREEIIGEIRQALARIFPNIELASLEHPLEDGTFRFTKGASKGFQFKNLSGGEKAAFDLMLDIIVRKREYDNTIFCIDEPESHMNARLQAELLSVLYDLIPENCQLFLATHSIGMMRRARDIEAENQQSVVFLDFGGRDFDKQQVIEPTKPNRRFWHQAYDVALDDLAALVAPSRVVICEGQPLTRQKERNHNHDARCYNTIFGDEFPETQFVSMGSANEVLEDKRGLAGALRLMFDSKIEIVQLIDRDDRTNATIAEERAKGVRILSKRNLESYLYDDEVLTALAESTENSGKITELLAEKRKFLSQTDGPTDDLKPARGQIFNACKRILNLTQRGDTADEFARETLAPLVKSGMIVYDELRCDIFGDV